MGKKSQDTSVAKVYGNTTTTNPYATSTTNGGGTTAKFISGNALDTIYNYVNNNISSILDDYMNPNLNSQTNQAKLNAFNKTLSSNSQKHLENNIINPLSNRNMIRSSQATDLYKNLSDKNTSALSNFVDELLSESQANSAEMLNNLLNAYMKGYDVISDMQNHSLKSSSDNISTITSAPSSNNIINTSNLSNALQKALSAYSGASL